MRLHVRVLAALAAILIGGCGAPGPTRPVETKADKPVVVRPIVVAERGGDELLKAIALLRDKNFAQAEANLEEIVRVRPDLPEAHFNLAWVRQQLGRHELVAASVRAGLERRPNEIGAWLLLALSERELGQFAESESSYLAALALAPDDARLHLNAGILYDLYLLRPASALGHFRRYQALQKASDTKVAGWIALLERKEAK